MRGRQSPRFQRRITMIRKALLAATILSLTQGVQVMAEVKKAEQTKRMVLVGASIGKDWHFEEIGQRLQRSDYRFDYVGAYQFDKENLVQDLIKSADKPAVVLIKECSTYFPGDADAYKKLVTQWVGELKAAGIQPMLVTTAPVGEPAGFVGKLKIKIKRLLGKSTWLDTVTQFNDWMKEYAKQENIPVFDLEAALRRSADDRYLKPEYDSGDMVHLTPAAYAEMDRQFAQFIAGWQKAPVK
jgi:lysophospholipase L1-like esterase